MIERRLELVRDFAELSAGMTVVEIACVDCERSHEVRLVELSEYDERNGLPVEGVAWRYEPDCDPSRDGWRGIDAIMVRENRIFRVVLGPPSRAATRPRHLERTR